MDLSWEEPWASPPLLWIMMSELQGWYWLTAGAAPSQISIFINDSSISELHFSIRSYIEQITNQIRKFFWSPAAAQNFLPAAFYFHLWLFWNPAIKFPWFLVGISTIVLTHRLQTEDLLILLSQQIKKVSVVIFQFLVPSQFTFQTQNLAKFSSGEENLTPADWSW